MESNFPKGSSLCKDCYNFVKISHWYPMFILFFGTRPGKTKSWRLKGISCTYCGQKNTLSVSTTPNYFHLFWIPVFRVSSFEMAECSHCKRRYFKEEFSEEMAKAVREELQ